MNIKTTIELTPEDIKDILVNYIKEEKGIDGDIVFNVREKLAGGGDVFFNRTVFDGATFTSEE